MQQAEGNGLLPAMCRTVYAALYAKSGRPCSGKHLQRISDNKQRRPAGVLHSHVAWTKVTHPRSGIPESLAELGCGS